MWKLVLTTAFCAASAVGAAAPETPTMRVAARPQTEPMQPLNAADFVVRVNGKEAPVLNAKTPRDGQMILLVLDLAEDMTDAQAARDALIAGLDKLPASTYVALIRAQDGPTVLVDPTADRKAIAEAIQASPVTGKAGLLDSLVAIESLADRIAEASNVRVAILFVTDSNVRNYREDFSNPVINSSDSHDLSRRFPQALIESKIQKLESEISTHETPLFIAHLRYSATTLSAAYQAGLKRLAEGTAGWSSFCASTAEIPEAIAQAFSAIESEYMLTVGLPAKTAPAVQVRVETRDQDKDSGEIVYRGRVHLRQR